jgi:hypothetical protein
MIASIDARSESMSEIKNITSQIEQSYLSKPLQLALADAQIPSAQAALKALRRGELPPALAPFHDEIQRAAPSVQRALASSLVNHDPARRALRHTFEPRSSKDVPQAMRAAGSPLADLAPLADASTPSDEDVYCAPDSLQSMLSPARYLVDIKEIAENFTPDNSAYELKARRPDLSSLKLSKDNLVTEVTTLSLANEVMTAFALKHRTEKTPDVTATEDKLYEDFATMTHPFSLPFDLHQTTVRLGLAAMRGMDLNRIARDTFDSIYALDNGSFNLVPNYRDKLGLCDKHLEILTQTPLPTDLGIPTAVDDFLRYTGISYEQLVELLGNNTIFDEHGSAYTPEQSFSSYINASGVVNGRALSALRCGYVPRLIASGDPASPSNASTGPLSIIRAATTASQSDLVRMTHLIRLNMATGLAFKDLNYLLTLASEVHGLPEPTISEATLSVVARYVEWRDRFDLSAERYCGLTGRVNEFRRENHQETSLMRQLFGADAEWLSRKLTEQSPFMSLGQSESAAIRRGLKLSEQDWALVLGLVDTRHHALDTAYLSALYRCSRIFPTLGWSTSGGFSLLDAIAPSFLETLSGKAGPALLTALDQLVWLAETLQEFKLSPEQVSAILSKPEPSLMYATQETANRVNQLYQDIAPILLDSNSFRNYALVPGDSATGTSPDVPIDWLAELKAPASGVIDSHGLVTNLTPKQIDEKVAAVLAARNAAHATTAQQGVTTIVRSAQEAACQTLAIDLGKPLSGATASIGPMLRWMSREMPGVNPYYALVQLLSANLRSDGTHVPTDVETLNGRPETLSFMVLLNCYIQAALTAGLEEQEIRMVAEHPDWVAKDMTGALDFKLFYFLFRLKRLQHEGATSADWISFFHQANAGGTSLNNILAELLDCDSATASNLVKDLAGNQPPRLVAEADLMARHVAVAKAITVGYSDLKAIRAMARAGPQSWAEKEAASRAVRVGMTNYGQEQDP